MQCFLSNSGNTEETVSALNEAADTGAVIAVITSGGELQKIAEEKGYPLALLPEVGQPRYAVLESLKALVSIFKSAGIIENDKVNQLVNTSDFLKKHSKDWQSVVPTDSNLAKQLASEAAGKSVVIYAGPKLSAAAYKWKISFNENGKQVAWWNQYSEFNHNEFIGWTKQPPVKPYFVVNLLSDFESDRIKKRFEVSDRLLSGMRPDPFNVRPEGETLLEQLLYTIMLGDFVSLYTAILSGINPEPVDLIEKFKLELKK